MTLEYLNQLAPHIVRKIQNELYHSDDHLIDFGNACDALLPELIRVHNEAIEAAEKEVKRWSQACEGDGELRLAALYILLESNIHNMKLPLPPEQGEKDG